MTMVGKTGLYVSILIIMALLCLIVFSENGILDYKVLKEKQAVIAHKTVAVESANQKLENEIKSLKNDMNYIKHVAKHEHDMSEENELIFKDKSDKKGNRP